jgi:hypothetical protein
VRLARALLATAVILAADLSRAQDRTALFSSLDVASLIGKPVTNAKWEQVARVDSVLLDPSTGRVTYFILSFVDGNERMALPWSAIAIDTRGRARLVSKKGALALLLPLGRLPSPTAVSHPADPHPLEGAPLPIAGFKAEGNGAAILQGRVTGRMTLPDGAGRRRVQLVVLAGTESVSVDLGAEEALRQMGLELRPGDDVQIEARKAGERVFAASVVRFDGATFRISPP